MIRINLLPHRAEKRKRRQVQFISLCIASALVAGILVGLGYGFMSARIFYQEKRNAFLKTEIAKLEKQIEELERLRAEIKALLARKEVVENLQSSRADVVHLMDQMLRILPPGVHLKSLKQTGNKITIVGVTQSDARVSTLMRAIDSSPWLDTPGLVEVHAVVGGSGGKERTNEFTLTFNLKKGADIAAAASAARAASAPVAASAPSAASAPATTSPAPAFVPAASTPALSGGSKKG